MKPGTPSSAGPLRGRPANQRSPASPRPASCRGSVRALRRSRPPRKGRRGAAVSVVSSVTFASVAAGGAHTCALTTSGAAYCWGRGESGQLGIPFRQSRATDAGPLPCSKVPVAVGGGLAFEQLAGGGAHTCGLTSDGSAYCWGTSNGQLGDNSTTNGVPDPGRDGAPVCQHRCGGAPHLRAHERWCGVLLGEQQPGPARRRHTDPFRAVAVTGGHTFQLIVAGGFDHR